MGKIAKGIITGGRLIGVIHESKVTLLDFETKDTLGEYSLFEDTNTRVSLSNDDRWLIIGSWRSGVKVLDLKNNGSFSFPDVQGMSYLDVFSRGNGVCCGENKSSGFQIINFEKMEVLKSSTRYERLIEVPERMEYLAFDFGYEKVSVLDELFQPKWEWEWESFGLIAYGFHQENAVLSGPNGQMAVVNMESRATNLLGESKKYSGIDAVHLDGKSIFVVASEYLRSRESALIRLNQNLEFEEVLGKIPPINGCVVISGKLIDLSGNVFDLVSGERVEKIDFGSSAI